MVRSSVKTVTYSSGSRKVARSRQLVAKAAQLLRTRMAGTPRAPLRTGGFYGLYNRRGRTELKTIDTDTVLSNIASAGALQLLNGVDQGTDYTQRIGRKIILKSLFFRVNFFPSATTASPTGTICRLLIVYDCQTNSAAPAVTDILQAAEYDAPMNLNNRDRFKVIYDKYIMMCATAYTTGALTAGDPCPKMLSKYKKMSLEEIFSGTANTVGSIATGSIYAMLIASSNNTVQADSYFRVRFEDA